MASSRRTVLGKVTLILLKCLDGTCHSRTEITAATGLPLSTGIGWSATSPPGGFSNAPPTAATVSGSRCGRSRPVGSSWTCAPRRLAAGGPGTGFRRRGPPQVLDDHHVAYLAQAPGGRLATSTPAPTLPAHDTALGKALLAFSSPRLWPRLSAAARPAELRGTRASATPTRSSTGLPPWAAAAPPAARSSPGAASLRPRAAARSARRAAAQRRAEPGAREQRRSLWPVAGRAPAHGPGCPGRRRGVALVFGAAVVASLIAWVVITVDPSDSSPFLRTYA